MHRPRPATEGRADFTVTNSQGCLYELEIGRPLAVRGEAWAALRTLELALLRHRPMDALVDGRPVRARVLLVASNHYRLDLFSLGERERLDEGLLHLYVATGLLPWTWEERTAPAFTIDGRRRT